MLLLIVSRAKVATLKPEIRIMSEDVTRWRPYVKGLFHVYKINGIMVFTLLKTRRAIF